MDKIKLLVEMSTDYFDIVAPDIEEYEPYPAELQEFWEFAEDVMRIPSDVYTVTKFHGAEAGTPELQVPAILVSFSAGALAASIQSLFQCIGKYFSRNSSREITIEKEGVKLTLKGRSLTEEKEFIKIFFPELLSNKNNVNRNGG